MHRGISPPRTPRLRPLFQLARTPHARGPQQPKIARGKSIRIADGSHGDVLRGPIADARQLPNLEQEIGNVHDSREYDTAVAYRRGQPADGLRAHGGQSDPGKIRLGQHGGGRKEMRQTAARVHRRAEFPH